MGDLRADLPPPQLHIGQMAENSIGCRRRPHEWHEATAENYFFVEARGVDPRWSYRSLTGLMESRRSRRPEDAKRRCAFGVFSDFWLSARGLKMFGFQKFQPKSF